MEGLANAPPLVWQWGALNKLGGNLSGPKYLENSWVSVCRVLDLGPGLDPRPGLWFL